MKQLLHTVLIAIVTLLSHYAAGEEGAATLCKDVTFALATMDSPGRIKVDRIVYDADGDMANVTVSWLHPIKTGVHFDYKVSANPGVCTDTDDTLMIRGTYAPLTNGTGASVTVPFSGDYLVQKCSSLVELTMSTQCRDSKGGNRPTQHTIFKAVPFDCLRYSIEHYACPTDDIDAQCDLPATVRWDGKAGKPALSWSPPAGPFGAPIYYSVRHGAAHLTTMVPTAEFKLWAFVDETQAQWKLPPTISSMHVAWPAPADDRLFHLGTQICAVYSTTRPPHWQQIVVRAFRCQCDQPDAKLDCRCGFVNQSGAQSPATTVSLTTTEALTTMHVVVATSTMSMDDALEAHLNEQHASDEHWLSNDALGGDIPDGLPDFLNRLVPPGTITSSGGDGRRRNAKHTGNVAGGPNSVADDGGAGAAAEGSSTEPPPPESVSCLPFAQVSCEISAELDITVHWHCWTASCRHRDKALVTWIAGVDGALSPQSARHRTVEAMSNSTVLAAREDIDLRHNLYSASVCLYDSDVVTQKDVELHWIEQYDRIAKIKLVVPEYLKSTQKKGWDETQKLNLALMVIGPISGMMILVAILLCICYAKWDAVSVCINRCSKKEYSPTRQAIAMKTVQRSSTESQSQYCTDDDSKYSPRVKQITQLDL